MKPYVTSDIAEELKVLGYKDPSVAYYISLPDGAKTKHTMRQAEKFDENWNVHPSRISAPTWTEAEDFIRDNFGLHLHICYIPEHKGWNVDVYQYKEYNGLVNSPFQFSKHASHREALTTGLRESFKVIYKTKFEEATFPHQPLK